MKNSSQPKSPLDEAETMGSYEELKSELQEISTILQDFESDLQPAVFRLLITEFYDGDLPIQADPTHSTPLDSPETVEVEQVDGEASPQASDRSKQSETPSSSFEDFVDDKKCDTHQHKALLAVYYTAEELGKTEVSDEDVEERYRDARWRPPARPRQTLINAKNDKGWFESTEDGNWEITYKGEMVVEHDLTTDDA